jgi:hypothetical protein
MTESGRSGQWDWIAEFGDPWVLGKNGCLTFARGMTEGGFSKASRWIPPPPYR